MAAYQFWQSFWSPLRTLLIGNEQHEGTQYTGPYAYAEPAATAVTEESALQLSAVWACVRLYSQTIASLPVYTYRMTDGGREKDENHWFARLMADRPNRFQTRFEFMEYQIANLMLHGNCYAKIKRVAGQITELMPMAAQQVEVQIMGGRVTYIYTHDGVIDVLAPESVWHVRINSDWLVGRSPLAFGRNMLGIAQAAESATSKVYANGAKPSGVLSLDKLLTPQQREQVRQNFGTLTTGDDNRLLVLEHGMKFEPISMSPQDIELLSSRKFQIDEICRWFGVPAILVNQNEGSTTLGSSTAEIITAFYKLNLRPVLEALECSVKTHLIGTERDNPYEVEFSFEALLRANQKERFEGYQIAINNGILTPNEARAMEWLSLMPSGDKLYMQGAMAPIESLGQNAGVTANGN